MLVATTCASPKRAMNLNLWMLSWKRKRGNDTFAPNFSYKLDDTYPGVHEHKVHLAEGEDHLEYRVDPPEDLVTGRVPGDLVEAAQLHAVVDHGAETERYIKKIGGE